MQRFEVTGMSCAACSSHVERAVAAVPGVRAVSVSLLTNSMQVEYSAPADADAICRAVADAGYAARPADARADADALADTETPRLKRRLIASLCFLVPLFYLTMGHMLGLPLPPLFAGGRHGGAVVCAGAAGTDAAGLLDQPRPFSSAGSTGCAAAPPAWTRWWPWAPVRRWSTACLPWG